MVKNKRQALDSFKLESFAPPDTDHRALTQKYENKKKIKCTLGKFPQKDLSFTGTNLLEEIAQQIVQWEEKDNKLIIEKFILYVLTSEQHKTDHLCSHLVTFEV